MIFFRIGKIGDVSPKALVLVLYTERREIVRRSGLSATVNGSLGLRVEPNSLKDPKKSRGHPQQKKVIEASRRFFQG